VIAKFEISCPSDYHDVGRKKSKNLVSGKKKSGA